MKRMTLKSRDKSSLSEHVKTVGIIEDKSITFFCQPIEDKSITFYLQPIYRGTRSFLIREKYPVAEGAGRQEDDKPVRNVPGGRIPGGKISFFPVIKINQADLDRIADQLDRAGKAKFVSVQ